MSWKGVTVTEQRQRFLEDYQLNYYSITELAERFCISRKTAYKWMNRFKQNGHGGFQELSRRAPFLAIISNSAGSAGRQLQEVTDSFFAYSAWPTRPSKGISICRGDLRAAGVSMAELQDIFRYLRRSIPYSAKVKIAAQFISQVSTQSQWTGKSVLGLSIPDSRYAEAFDYTVSTGKQVKTIPDMVSASGSRASSGLISQPIPPFPAEVLGSSRRSRHGRLHQLTLFWIAPGITGTWPR